MSETTVTLDIPPGETLLRALLSHGSGVAHDCGGAQACASCRVTVLAGLQRLLPANEDEEDLLDRMAAPPNSRLACQAVSAGGEFLIELLGTPCPIVVRSSDPEHGPISLSDAAARHLARQLAGNPRCAAVRISLHPAGCSGLMYRIEPVEAPRDADEVFESAGVVLIVDAQSLPRLAGTRIHLVAEGLGTRLQFENPNAIGACGCGKSFGAA